MSGLKENFDSVDKEEASAKLEKSIQNLTRQQLNTQDKMAPGISMESEVERVASSNLELAEMVSWDTLSY